ncbi:MAG TPA: protein kinase [Pyrinomonadaceae bacterium]|jgi:serine/threonine protein kinase
MLIGKQFGRYEIRSKIGSGGMGEVYAAFDAELGRRVAVKILPAEFSSDDARKNRFRQEARAASALNHPNIITIYEIGENEHGSFLVTELIDGATLREIIKKERLPLVRALKIVEQIANALVAAHSARIVHRDIKPENVMVRHDGIVKVLDFGLAKPTAPSEETDEQIKTLPGMVMGSVRYMSPEQARGLKVDERTDIWSLGVVLYEMLTGHAPFDGETTSDTIAALIYKEPAPVVNFVPNAPAELQRIVRKALQKDRDERYQHVKDLALDLKDLIYELEHVMSGERLRSVSADIDLSENPTMIHRTHSTKDNALTTAGMSIPPSEKTSKSRSMLPLAALAAIVLPAALGFGFYKWFGAKTLPAVSAFEKPQAARVNTDGKVANPAISPDGKYVAYLSGDVGNRSLVVRQVATDSAVTIVPPTPLNLSGVTFSPDGDYVYYLLTSEDGVINTLYRVPALGGTPKRLIEDVDSAVTFAPDGNRLAFHRNLSKEAITIIYTANIDGSNVEPLLRSDETAFNVVANPRWSPDGRIILVRAFNNFGGTVEKNEIAEIFVAEKKLAVWRAAREFHSVFEFSWLKDGSGFLFTGQETPDSPVQIFRAVYETGEFYPVTNDINSYNSLGLTADDKAIVTLKSNLSSSIWSYNPASRQFDQLTAESANLEGNYGLSEARGGKLVYGRKDGNDVTLWLTEGGSARPLSGEIRRVFVNPKITFDGRWIVFSSKQSGAARIWRVDADGRNLVQLTREKTNHGDFNPQLTPDGKWIVYQQYASGANAKSAIMKVSIDGGESSVLYSDDQHNVQNATISPDGKFIAFDSYRTSDFDKKIRVATFENNAFGQIVKEFDADQINAYLWSPDGKSLTFLSSRSGVQNLWRLPLDGAAPQPVTDFKTGRIFNFTWAADGKKLYIVRGNINSDLILIRDRTISDS